MDNIILKIREELKQNIDLKYKSFQSKLIPNINESTILGVKTPILKVIAKKYASREDITLFLNDLPHQYFEENQIHSFIISLNKDFNETIKLVESFLPYINNWATCDQLNPKAFKSDESLILYLNKWIDLGYTYHIRFSILMYMSKYLGQNFKKEYALRIAKITSNEYYINMMISWYFATALAKNYDEVIDILESKELSKFIQNKTIQKACESLRVTSSHKQYLKTLKIM